MVSLLNLQGYVNWLFWSQRQQTLIVATLLSSTCEAILLNPFLCGQQGVPQGFASPICFGSDFMVTELYGSQWGEFGKKCFCSVTLLATWPRFSFCFGFFFFSCFACSSSMWLIVAGLMCDNYFLRCLEALSSKEGELQLCVLFCT